MGRGLARLGQVGRDGRRGRAAVGAHAVDGRDVARAAHGRGQALLAPRPEVGAVHLERPAGAGAQRARRHGPRAVGLDDLAPVAERRRRRPRRAPGRRRRRPGPGTRVETSCWRHELAGSRRRGRRGGRRASRRGRRRSAARQPARNQRRLAPATFHSASSSTNSGITAAAGRRGRRRSPPSRAWLSASRRSRRNHMIEFVMPCSPVPARSRGSRPSRVSRASGRTVPRTHSDARSTRVGL